MIDDEARETPRPRSAVPWVLVAGLVLFAAGLLLSPWFETNVRTRLPGALQRPDVESLAVRVEREAGTITALEARVAALETRPATSAPLGDAATTPRALNDPVPLALGGGPSAERLARLEARIEALDRGQAQASTRLDNVSAELAGINVKIEQVGGNAARSIEAAAASAEKARGVLLVTAARRAAEQGQSLAVLAPALRRHFAAADADAVERLLTASPGAPTLAVLRRRFAQIRPQLAESAEPEQADTLWTQFKAGVASLVQVREKGAAAAQTANEARLADMATRLSQGDVAGALLAMQRLPARTQQLARQWRISAEAYANSYGALQQLEASVLLEDTDLPLTAPAAGQQKPAQSL
ncbi:COG4223 family protein [Sphingosinicella xenopeptidilytica]|uniref:COG4223 family protein n=1 Tax=Sphingosinicella xenopeptidilytica TaxID=364098 RepID=A0ABW3C1D8_SPHXN